MRQTRRRNSGFTLTEVLAAVVLMAIALVPVLRALTGAQVVGAKVERTTRSLVLAAQKIEEIRGAALTSFGTDFSTSSGVLAMGYLCTVQDGQESSALKSIRVTVGYDVDGDGILDGDEEDAVLNTLVANRQ